MIFLIVYLRIRHACQGCRPQKFHFRTAHFVPLPLWRIHPFPHNQNKKHTEKVCFLFWWEWVDSNHLSSKTTDLQSAPALQLRRTPRTCFFVCHNIYGATLPTLPKADKKAKEFWACAGVGEPGQTVNLLA